MIPTRNTLNLINDSIAQNTTIFGVDPATKVALVVSPFVPGPDVLFADLTLASFAGSTPITVPAPPQLETIDNETGRFGVLMKEPVGGYKFLCTTAPDTPETVYGWVVYDEEDALLYFTELLPNPVVITDVGNFVELTAVLGYLSMDAWGNLDA